MQILDWGGEREREEEREREGSKECCSRIVQIAYSTQSLQEQFIDYMAVINQSINQLYIRAEVLSLRSTLESPGELLKTSVPRPYPGPTKAESGRFWASVGPGHPVLKGSQATPIWHGAGVENSPRGMGCNCVTLGHLLAVNWGELLSISEPRLPRRSGRLNRMQLV